jgi:phosphoglucomutase
MTVMEKYLVWCEKATEDADVVRELQAMAGNEKEIAERFSVDLAFGTGGLRGIIGAGTSLMNIYTVRRATQGLAQELLEHYEHPSVAIAYDSRIKSELFSREAAGVMAANGIRVWIYPELMPTPMLSFAVRELHCQGGINVTASHNPSKYNGYKVYGADGCQLTDADAGQVTAQINKVDLFDDVKHMSFDEGLASGMIRFIGEDVRESYMQNVLKQCVHPELCRAAGLKLMYTPLNGAGNKPVREVLRRMGVENVTVVPQQELPDGNFPTCPYPNPEIRQVFECGLEMAKTDAPDLMLATDPDCDRVGIAVRDGDDYRLFTGNEVGAMLLYYILSQRTAMDTLPERPVAIKTIVTTPIVEAIAAKFGCEVISVLTGFKYIGEQIGELEAKGEENRYQLGFEESYGYLSGSYVRDKDAVYGAMAICDMASYYKSQGKTLIDVIEEIYHEFGYYVNTVASFEFQGLAGMAQMKSIMNDIRHDAPKTICGKQVVRFNDYLTSLSYDLVGGTEDVIHLPKSNVLSFFLSDGSNLIIRPSGTEPKIKVYIASVGASRAESIATGEQLMTEAKRMLGVL